MSTRLSSLSKCIAVLMLTMLLSICCTNYAIARTEPDLTGLWMESNNFPASSVIKFEKTGATWTGVYSQVSSMQQMWGFKVGEVVIRGNFEGDTFKGAVLLKIKPSTVEECRTESAYWAPIKMKLAESSKLYGVWLQSFMDRKNHCVVYAEKWQVYGLERLQLK